MHANENESEPFCVISVTKRNVSSSTFRFSRKFVSVPKLTLRVPEEVPACQKWLEVPSARHSSCLSDTRAGTVPILDLSCSSCLSLSRASDFIARKFSSTLVALAIRGFQIKVVDYLFIHFLLGNTENSVFFLDLLRPVRENIHGSFANVFYGLTTK